MYVTEVRPNESLADVALRTGVTAEQLVSLNGLPSQAVTRGQALLVPSNRFVAQQGTSLWRLAEISGITLERLSRANPGAARALYPGRTLRIPEPIQQRAEVIGYLPITDPGVNAEDITPWARQLTWVAIFSHLITEEGELPPLNDAAAIRATYAAGARPLMSIANMEPGGAFSPEIARTIITNAEIRERVIANILRTMEAKGYAGVDSDIENIPRDLRAGYVNFLRELKARLGNRPLNVAVPPKYDETTFGYARGHDYQGIGQVADRIYLMNYEFHWVGGPPGAIAPLPQTRRVMQYAASLMPKQKILNGISTTAYDWELPDTPENKARPWPSDEAVQIAVRNQANIRYAEPAESPWYRYTAEGGRQREVWFEDARSIMAKFRVMRELGLGGLGIWHLGARNSQLPPLIDYFYDVVRQ
ncbi:MAG TPA: glycosyl hydrolase family 18 protein [Symbiobacteriaceae bacterium]|nr:glycosyl hydrolase family 18 protein [Symbiobacteriaceae bacterium]